MELSQWAQYYQSRVGESYPAYVRKKYDLFLKEILVNTTSDTQFIEAGCGIATISKILNGKGLITGFDLDKDQVTLANRNVQGMSVNIQLGNVLDSDCYKPVCKDLVIHSHGVLEHFEDEFIKSTIEVQKSMGAKLVHYVPLEGWITPSFGDERLLPLEYWVDTFKPKEFFTFSDGKDGILIW